MHQIDHNRSLHTIILGNNAFSEHSIILIYWFYLFWIKMGLEIMLVHMHSVQCNSDKNIFYDTYWASRFESSISIHHFFSESNIQTNLISSN